MICGREEGTIWPGARTISSTQAKADQRRKAPTVAAMSRTVVEGRVA